MCLKRKKYTYYLPKLRRYITIKARDESYATWKLLNIFYLREKDVEDWVIVKVE